ncbi:exported protein of unknown function [Bradyrhizobium vignae]|uniref:Uncharacterized protein n=1 Tax=Bradyrhizobium vignae TaxID=1549949 RepID=A0A2U3PUE3_9BRAD|nr:exported protein of unknown function [Bradyrhizobium vignae]
MRLAGAVGLLLSFATTSALAANFTPIPGKGIYRNNIIKIACDQRAASVCQQQANGCGNICKAGRDYQLCWQGCLNRYKECKYSAGCGDL